MDRRQGTNDCATPEQGVPVLGAIAGGLLEPFTDAVEQLDFSSLLLPTYAPAGGRQHDRRLPDVVIMRPVPEPDQLKMAPSLQQE